MKIVRNSSLYKWIFERKKIQSKNVLHQRSMRNIENWWIMQKWIKCLRRKCFYTNVLCLLVLLCILFKTQTKHHSILLNNFRAFFIYVRRKFFPNESFSLCLCILYYPALFIIQTPDWLNNISIEIYQWTFFWVNPGH